MQSAEAVAAKRRVLVEALTMCLARSKVKEVVPLEMIQSILESASGELWREGEFRLEMIWKVLCQQPGLSPHVVAPPLLVFKSFEAELGVPVRIPQALSAIPRAEQVKLLEQIKVTKADFAKAIQQMHELATKAPVETKNNVANIAQEAMDATAPIPRAKKGPSPRRKLLAALLATAAVIAIGVSLAITLRDPANDSDLSDVAPILQLSDGKRVGQTMTARITDSRWETLGPDEQRRIATQLFEREQSKGVRVLTLTDGQGRVRINASDAVGRTLIQIH